MRDRRRITKAALIASVLSGAPSTGYMLLTSRSVSASVRYALQASRAVGTLVPPGRPSLFKGAAAHVGISLAMAELLARSLPETHAVAWGASGGLAMGVVNVGIIGRRFPDIRALPLLPQLADNVAFGVVFAVAVDG